MAVSSVVRLGHNETVDWSSKIKQTKKTMKQSFLEVEISFEFHESSSRIWSAKCDGGDNYPKNPSVLSSVQVTTTANCSSTGVTKLYRL
jgi:hypothetical protein